MVDFLFLFDYIATWNNVPNEQSCLGHSNFADNNTFQDKIAGTYQTQERYLVCQIYNDDLSMTL